MAQPDAQWLDELEKKVHQAARAVRELRGENQRLAKLNEELEGRLTELQQGEGKAGWEKERKEIRDRVETITRGLEKLLQE